MTDNMDNYIGKLLKSERCRQRLEAEALYTGVCNQSVYNKLENGKHTGSIHEVEILLQRLGISSGRAGWYLNRSEYDEVNARLLILEEIRAGNVNKAAERLGVYEEEYVRRSHLNVQFAIYMRARLTELGGDIKEALKLYEQAVECTLKNYASNEHICISMYEYFIIANVARLSAALGDSEKSERIYNRLITYCENMEIEEWNLACMYPKLICELLEVRKPDMLGNYERQRMYTRCMSALNILRNTSKLHYVCPLLRYRKILSELLSKEQDKSWDEFLKHYEDLRKRYGYEGELLEWYPYYIDCGFQQVEKLIEERRCMHGMSMEQLAEGICSTETVSRIINGRNSPCYNNAYRLLEKLGLKGALRSDIVASPTMEGHKLWDALVNCKVMDDHVTSQEIYNKLCDELDSSMEINCMAMACERIILDDYVPEVDYDKVAEKYRKLLPFPITDAGKYKCLTRIEGMIINRYFDCMNKLRNYEQLDVYEKLCENYSEIELSKKIHASRYESIVVRCADFRSNTGEFEKSNRLAEDGIRVELECERMHALSSLLYCIAWNNAEWGRISDGDIELCWCAYRMAEYKREISKMERYKNWIKKH